MNNIGHKAPLFPRQTALFDAEEWYQQLLSKRLGKPYMPIVRNTFGYYNMATNYLSGIIAEAQAIERVAIFNIDHMAQIYFTGKDAGNLLDRVLTARISNMAVGQCKYSLLLNEDGTVRDDMIVMKRSLESYIMVVNAGHDITDTIVVDGKEVAIVSDADYIMSYKKSHEIVEAKDISDQFVKIDIQGPFSYKLITKIFGKEVLKNRANPEKNMNFFTFNEVLINEKTYIFSRTGYTNRWGWETYIPIEHAQEIFQTIISTALEVGGLLVGLGGRDENRISAGNVGLPLMGQEYDGFHTPTNAPLFDVSMDFTKEFVGKTALLKDISLKVDKRLVIIIAEGNVVSCGVYLDGKRLGSITSSIVSPNVVHEKREFIGSARKNVNDIHGTATIALAWLYESPYKKDAQSKDILSEDGKPVRIKVELYREKDGLPTGNPILGYISSDGVSPSTASIPLKTIEFY
jgi:aminomethyltransferase